MTKGACRSFMTANGVTQTQEVMNFKPKELDQESRAYVLEETPAVLAVGKKCMEQGYSFIWMSGCDPYLMDKTGACTPLTVRDNIPYIKLNDPKKRHQKFRSTESSIIRHIQQMFTEGTLDNEKVEYGRAVTCSSEALPGVEDEAPLPPPADEPREGEGSDLDDEHSGGEKGDDEEGIIEAKPDDDIGELEIDVIDGVPRLAKPGSLKGEASTLAHILTHRYKNPYCEACVRAKMKHRKTKKGSVQPTTQEIR